MTTSHEVVKAWAKRHGLSLRMASVIISGHDGQALVGQGGTIAALARRGIAAQRSCGGRLWFLSRHGLSLLAEIEAPQQKRPRVTGAIRITTT